MIPVRGCCLDVVGLLPGCRLGFVPGGGGAGWSGSACVGMPHCWRSHATALDSINPSFCTFVP